MNPLPPDLKPVELTEDHGAHKAGDVLTLNSGLASEWIEKGKAKEFDPNALNPTQDRRVTAAPTTRVTKPPETTD